MRLIVLLICSLGAASCPLSRFTNQVEMTVCAADSSKEWFLDDSGLALFVAAHGVGTHAGPAAQSALDALRKELALSRHVLATSPPGLSSDKENAIARALSNAVRSTSAHLNSLGLDGGAEIDLVFVRGPIAWVAHVGTKSVALVRGSSVFPLTDKHTLWDDAERGIAPRPAGLTEEQARATLTRLVGFEPDVEVDMAAVDLKPGDSIVLLGADPDDLVRRKDFTLGRNIGQMGVHATPTLVSHTKIPFAFILDYKRINSGEAFPAHCAVVRLQH